MYGPDCDTSRGIIGFRTNLQCQGFASGVFNNNQWVSIAAYDFVWWHRISIQGREDPQFLEYTISVSVAFTVDGNVWTPYKDSKILNASYDKWSAIAIELESSYVIFLKDNF